MPILSALSRRFQDLLTTDAKPDPPRISIEGSLVPSDSSKTCSEKTNSNQTSCDEEHGKEFVLNREEFESSATNDAIPIREPNENSNTSRKDTSPTSSTQNQNEDSKRPNPKTRFKSKQSKQGTQGGAGVVNYNIVNSNGVKIGSRTSYICNVHQYAGNGDTAGNQSEGNSMESKSRTMPEEVRLLTVLDEEITIPDILLIKTHLGHGWKEIARRLSYSEGQIEQFAENYHLLGIDEVIYQLLLDWKQANTKNAKIGTLVRLLWTCREYDCAERLAAAYNRNKT